MEKEEIKTQIAVLGSGPAGYIAAIRARQLGAKVILVEREKLGGVCMNAGCIPTKALRESAKMTQHIKKAREFGIEASLDTIDWGTAVERKNRIVKNLNIGLESLLQKNGISVLKGKGIVTAPHEIQVETKEGNIQVTCEKMILASGSRPFIPEIPGIHLKGVITSTEALNLSQIPESMAILGAGVIGVEFATCFAALGTKVTLLEKQKEFLPETGEEAPKEILKHLKRLGIGFRFQSQIIKIEKGDQGLSITYDTGEKKEQLSCEVILVAAGRRLNLEDFTQLSLKTKNHAVCVDEFMQTSEKDVYAAGDITGGPLLAHFAYAQGRVAAENALGKKSTLDPMTVSSCIYTIPEFARVGLTEEEALAKGVPIKKGYFSFRQNGRALTLGKREGYVKILLNEKEEVIGGEILGTDASEMITEISMAVAAKIKAEFLADMIYPHPTLNEAVWEAYRDAIGSSIHKG